MVVPPQNGFTLTELLVVIAVIAILAAMLVPAINMVRGAAMASRCGSNVRQITMASSLYAQDNEGYLLDHQLWRQLIVPYVEATATGNTGTSKAGGSVLQDCPTWKGNANISTGSGQFGYDRRGQGYGINPAPGNDRDAAGEDRAYNSYVGASATFGPGFKPFALASLTHPSKRIWAFDSDSYNVDPLPSTRVDTANTKLGGGRHGAVAVWSFVDGHVERRYSNEMRIWKQQGSSLTYPYQAIAPVATISFHSPESGSALWNALFAPGRNP